MGIFSFLKMMSCACYWHSHKRCHFVPTLRLSRLISKIYGNLLDNPPSNATHESRNKVSSKDFWGTMVVNTSWTGGGIGGTHKFPDKYNLVPSQIVYSGWGVPHHAVCQQCLLGWTHVEAVRITTWILPLKLTLNMRPEKGAPEKHKCLSEVNYTYTGIRAMLVWQKNGISKVVHD